MENFRDFKFGESDYLFSFCYMLNFWNGYVSEDNFFLYECLIKVLSFFIRFIIFIIILLFKILLICDFWEIV